MNKILLAEFQQLTLCVLSIQELEPPKKRLERNI